MNPAEKLRLFLAIQIPESVKAELQRFQDGLRPLLPRQGVRWANPGQFHLTMKFLGNVAASDVDALTGTARAVCAAAPPIPLRVEGVGFFPNSFAPRVFWVDIKSTNQLLHTLQQHLEAAVGRFAEKVEAKNFAAHVTLARFEKLRQGVLEKFIARLEMDKFFGEWTASDVELVQSRLLPSGAVHAPLAVFRTKNE